MREWAAGNVGPRGNPYAVPIKIEVLCTMCLVAKVLPLSCTSLVRGNLSWCAGKSLVLRTPVQLPAQLLLLRSLADTHSRRLAWCASAFKRLMHAGWVTQES